MDPIKKSFDKVKEDMALLNNEISLIKKDLKETREEMVSFCFILKEMNNILKKPPLQGKIDQRNNTQNQTFPTHNPTHNTQNQTFPTHNPTHKQPLKALKDQNIAISTGNEGVPTDKQTNRQTDKQTPFNIFTPSYLKGNFNLSYKDPPNEISLIQNQKNINKEENSSKGKLDSIDNAARILNSLDSIKKDIRLKFKRLTDQEILVFSTLYQLDEEEGYTEYKTLSKKLNLSESSIRDYVGRLIKKGIPVDKKRVNNKIIHLSIPENLKKIASLPTILQLRDL